MNNNNIDFQEIFQKFKSFVDTASNWFENNVADNFVGLLKSIGVLFIDILRFIADLIQSFVS